MENKMTGVRQIRGIGGLVTRGGFMNLSSPEQTIPESAARTRWEEPRIVLERSLIVSAQGGPPGAPPGFKAEGAPMRPFGYLGPLDTSQDTGMCG
jgi:hypothetical protein